MAILPVIKISQKWILNAVLLPVLQGANSIEKSMERCLVLSVKRPVPVMFNREMVVNELMAITGFERKFFNVKMFMTDEHIIWMPNKQIRDEIVIQYNTMVVQGISYELKKWDADYLIASIVMKHNRGSYFCVIGTCNFVMCKKFYVIFIYLLV